MKTAPTNTDDIIDSRDVIARIKELESDRDAIGDPADADNKADAKSIREALAAWEEHGDGPELKALLALQEQAEGYCSDWTYGAQLIRDSYFKDYAQQYADDIGAIDRNASWPTTCIDWEAAANELQSDYTSVEFDGVTYWVR